MKRVMRMSAKALGVVVIVCSAAGHAAASLPVVPEINPSVIPAALGAVTAGVLMLRARRGSK